MKTKNVHFEYIVLSVVADVMLIIGLVVGVLGYIQLAELYAFKEAIIVLISGIVLGFMLYSLIKILAKTAHNVQVISYNSEIEMTTKAEEQDRKNKEQNKIIGFGMNEQQ